MKDVHVVDKKMTRNGRKTAAYEFQILNMYHLLIGKSIKNYLQDFLRMFLDRIIVQAPTICHFKGLGMRNLEYEKRICQKTHTKAKIPRSMLSSFF